MKTRRITVLTILAGLLSLTGPAQDLPAQLGLEPVALSNDELFVLSQVPLVTLPDAYKGSDAPLLPSSIDNSTQPYFRPITWQSGYECGQSAGVAFNFTYEIDRLRNLPANVTTNQYPTHFVWDFLNNGENYVGASFFDSWEIIRACGTMNVADYGGTLNYGGFKRWISGYDMYYNGMHNRLTAVKSIRCDTPEGLETLKYWLVDHLEGSTVGGVANFYAQYFSSTPNVLPAGTPEAGKFVQTSWGGSPSHAWTVVGYNDSIRFDYNGDGQYTNTIDITGDGIVNMRDWEIGGLKFANGYAGTGWCNNGFCYLMYKTLADNIGYGGIWNHSVYIVDVKQDCNPRLTMKVVLNHVSRNRLKVTVGMSTDLTVQVPVFVYEFPIFNYQGGPFYMQGGTNESDKTIEFGLDLAPVLSQLTSGQTAKFFLQVQENDPGNSSAGTIVSAALIDYTSGTPVTINFPSSNVPLVNNDFTRISVNHTVNFSKPNIATSVLPMATVYQPYSQLITASGGTPPYLWDVKLDYPESVAMATFPGASAQQLTLTNNGSGYAIKTLDFSFPFYKKMVNKLYVYADGYILFDDQPYTYPYLVDKKLLFRQTSIISPFMADLQIYPSNGDGVWYEGDASSATIRWKAAISGMPSSSAINVAVKIYANGTIEYYYGNMNFPTGLLWTGGLSGGDNKNYQYSMYNGASAVPAGTLDKFQPCGWPVEMTLSEEGYFYGTPQYAYNNLPIKFRVTDNNGISNTKTLNFSANGLVVTYSILSGGDTIVEYGETADVSISISNIGSQQVTNVNTTISETDPFIVLTDSIQYVGSINPGQLLSFPNAFQFTVSSVIPNQHAFTLDFHLTSAQQNFEKELPITAYAPDIHISETTIVDGDNGQLDPGETAVLDISLSNLGGAGVNNMSIALASADPLLTIGGEPIVIPLLRPDSTQVISFPLTASSDAAFEHLYRTGISLSGGNNFSQSDSIYLLSADIIEDFESGTFDKYDWQFISVPWTIDTYQPYEGSFCTRSGWIWDNQYTELMIQVNVLEDGYISFMRKTACENDPIGTNYDHLEFHIDNYEMGRWDGNTGWYQETYPVTKGIRQFKWIYRKDASISSYSDCAWIDFVTFPPIAGALPVISASPGALEKNLETGMTGSDTISISNIGGGLLNYTVMVFDTMANKLKETTQLSGSYITCNMSSYVPGQAVSWNFTVTNASPDNEYIREIKMDFPQGIIISGATNFSGGSLGDLVFDGTTGNGPSIIWHGESTGNRGVIKPGETATASVNGFVGEDHTYDVFVVYDIRGDQAGGMPHVTPGEIRIANSGLGNSWLSFSAATGDLLPGETDKIGVNYNAEGLQPDDYETRILVRDLYNNIISIPVILHVNYLSVINNVQNDNGSRLGDNYPNPFMQTTTIPYTLTDKSFVTIMIYDVQGRPVRSLIENMHMQGRYEIVWDGRDDRGDPVAPGIYECRMTAADYTGSKKMIIFR